RLNVRHALPAVVREIARTETSCLRRSRAESPPPRGPLAHLHGPLDGEVFPSVAPPTDEDDGRGAGAVEPERRLVAVDFAYVESDASPGVDVVWDDDGAE